MLTNKTIFLPLYIKLGLMKQYVRILDKDEHCFRSLCSAFPGLSEENLKAGIFDGSKIWKMIRYKDFMASTTTIEKRIWHAFVEVVNNFLGNRKTDNYMKIVTELIAWFEMHDGNMSIKIYFLFSHLDKFQGEIGYTHDGWLLLEPEERRYWSESFWKIRKNKISTFMIWLRLSKEKETRIKCPLIFEVYFFPHTEHCIVIKWIHLFRKITTT